jgi:hypothetical protein
MVSAFFRYLRRGQRKANCQARRKPALSVELLEKREVLTAFTPGNLIILRAGDGGLYSGTAPLFLDEYNIASGTVVQTVAIPNNQLVGGPGNQPITIDLSAAAGNGQLNRSYDGSVLTFGGLDSGINSTTATGSADRVLAMAGNDPAASGFLDVTTHGQFYVGDDNRGGIAESASGPIWAVGHPNQAGGAVSQGVHYFPTTGPSIGTQVSAGANIRGATIGFDNRLYFSTAGSTQTGLAGIYTEAQALPTAANPASDVPVVSALFAASKLGGIYLADVNGTGILQNGDRLYFLDDGTVGGAGTGGLYVSTYNTAYPGNHWSTAVRLGDGIIADQPNPQPSAQLRGLAGTVISPTETDLYVTEFDNVAGNNSYVLKFTDAGTGVNIASASESGNTVTITTAVPHNFTTGQTVVVDGINTGLGGTTIVTDGYNGSWVITVIDSTHFTFTDTNTHGTGLATVTNQGAANVAVNPSIVNTLADGTVAISGSTFAAQGLRGVAFAPVAPTSVNLTFTPANPESPGTQVTFTASVTNTQVTPTGVITFIDRNTNTVLGQGVIQSGLLAIGVPNGGSGYSATPTVTITDPTGTGATAMATVSNGVITGITITNPGSGYTNPTVTITDASGSGATALVTSLAATFSTIPVGNHYFSAYFAGNGPAALASANSNTLQVLEAGSNASSTSLSASLTAVAVGRAVTLTATVSGNSSSYGIPPIGTVSIYNGGTDVSHLIGTSTLSGPISVTLANGGSGYSSTPIVTVLDPTGTGATAVATVSGGVITAITMTNPGSGYTNPTVAITDPSGTGATALVTTSFTASLTTSFATIGAQNLTAIYNGDKTFASTSDTTTVTTAVNATVTITSSANNVPVGTAPTYTVTLNGNTTLGSPAGTVQFFLDGTALGAAQTLIAGPNNTATASVVSTALGAGSHFVTVTYTATGVTNPYTGFAGDTTTAAHGVAFIETAQQAFTPGNLIAVQRGDGTVNLGSSGYLVFLDEYTPAGVLVQQIALPNVDSGSNAALLLSGQNGAEGLLERSADGYYLTLAGYDVSVGQQFVTSTFPFQFGRTIARVDQLGNIDTSTVISTMAGSSVPYNPLDVVSFDGTQFWLVSNLPTGNTMESGIEYIASLGATSATQIGSMGTTGAAIGIAGGQLYAASTDLSSGGVWQVGAGLPTTPATLAGLPGLLDSYQAVFPNMQNPKQLLFFNHNDGTSNNPDTLYIADQSNGLLKFWFDGTHWIFGNGSLTNPFGQKLIFSGGATGVIGYVVNPGPNAHFQLFVTGSNVQGQNPNQIASFLDAGAYNGGFSSGTFNTLAFVGATGIPPSPNGNENFAGLAWVPGYHTTTQLATSANPAAVGDMITFTATVTATTGIPTGVVTFYDGTTVLGSMTLNGSGVATFTINSLAAGDHSITAFYNGDVTDGTSTSAVMTQTITSPGAPAPAPHVGSTTSLLPASSASIPPAGAAPATVIDVATTSVTTPTDTGTAAQIPALTTLATVGNAFLDLGVAKVSSIPTTLLTSKSPDTTDTGSLSIIGQPLNLTVPVIGGMDEFYRLLGAQGRETTSLWSFDSGEEGLLGL